MLPEQFLYQCSQNKKLKIIDTDRNIFKDVIIHDISLKSHGSDEDKDYQQEEFLFNNVRRGNTVLQVYKNNQLQQSIWGRKGLKKFFDMRVSDIILNNKILEPIVNCFKQGHDVELYQLEKANGENAQVSFCQILDCWVIASKNVSLLAFSVEDLEIYSDSRFRFAKLIAQIWFQSLKTIPDIESFKNEMDQKTLVGEYCGNSNHQHLIKYNKEQIIWFAITQFDSENSSQDVESSHKFFKKHNLQIVNVKHLGIFQTLSEFTERYQANLNEVERSSLNTQQEGAVFYIQDYNDKVVLNLCKAKTLEYRIFRKLREKLKIHLQKSSQEKLLTSFEKEVKELCKLNLPPMPLKHYLNFANTAFIFINYEPDLKKLFENQYISFLERIQEIIDKGIIPQQIPDIQAPQTIYAFIPISIPGMGKSTFQKLIAQKNKLICISSDEIRFNLMQKERISDKISDEELFKKTRFTADKEFDYQVKEALKQREQGNLILFLDKNHPPNGINKSIQLLRNNKPQNCNLIICAITPQCNEPLFMEFPFSANFLIKCLWRIQNRHNHLTLNGSGIQTIGIMMMFISMFNKFKLNESQFDEVFRIDFTNESKPLDVEPQFLELLGNLLEKSTNNSNCIVSKLELVHYIETHPIVDQFDDMDEKIQLILNKIEQ